MNMVHARQIRLLRRRADLPLAAAALAQGLVPPLAVAAARHGIAAAAAGAAAVAASVWWGANTVAHNHIHNPLFRRRGWNRACSLWLTVATGIPQSLWRARHLAHHAGGRAPAVPRAAFAEAALVALAWAGLAALGPLGFAAAYLPGFALGLALCHCQGHFEHAGGAAGVSHHGALHNLLWFNDGYHAEHHARPSLHWSRLPSLAGAPAVVSRWPPLLRWLDALAADRLLGLALIALEHLAIALAPVRRFVLARHARAIAALLPAAGRVERACVVGGGLFPRTALVLRRLLPECRITIVDASARSLAVARGLLDDGAVRFEHARWDRRRGAGFDLVVLPLGYVGDRAAEYAAPAARALLVHDWLWRRRGRSRVVSLLLLKRVNLIVR